MDTKKIVSVAAVVFLIFFVVTQPSQAADITHTIWDGIVNIAHGIANFIDNL